MDVEHPVRGPVLPYPYLYHASSCHPQHTHITSALLPGPLTASWATPPAATHRCASNDHHHPVASWATPPAATSQTTMTLPKTAQHPPPRKRLQQLDPRPDGGPHTRQPPRNSRLHHHPTTYRLSQTTPTRTHRHPSLHITQLPTDLTTTTHGGQHGHIPKQPHDDDTV